MIFIKLFGFIALAYLFGKGFAISYEEKMLEKDKEMKKLKDEIQYAYDIFEMHKKTLINTIEEIHEEKRVLQNDLDAANYLLRSKNEVSRLRER